MRLTKTLILCIVLYFTFPQEGFSQDFDGYALYNSVNNNTAYLIDQEGDIAHTWNCDYACNYATLLMDNGNLMRGTINPGNQIQGAAVGGRVQEIDPNGDIVWDFVYSSADYVTHHDITLMPNGGVLLTAWEVKSNAELVQAGYDGNGSKYPTHFIEVQPDGNGGGMIVWEWHMFDHMIQDHDATKDNYGVVADHPELMNVNVESGGMGGPGGGGDWFHVNGVNYNAELDQITFSSRFLSEIFIIDHSTTTEEAAGHTGGNSGKGGDFLYRWGNPSNYGAPGNQIIDGAVHDARWIPNDGRPNGGYLQFFNNEGGGGNSSAVDAINPPLSADGYNYDLTPGEAFGPASHDWRHVCEEYAWGQSASNRMPNGNVFVAMSGEYMYEATETGEIVWQYSAGPQKAFRYTCDHPGVQALIAQDVLQDDFCMVVDVNEVNTYDVDVSPNPSNGLLNITGLPLGEQNVDIVVSDVFGKQIARVSNMPTVDMTAYTTGIYLLTFYVDNAKPFTKKVSVVK